MALLLSTCQGESCDELDADLFTAWTEILREPAEETERVIGLAPANEVSWYVQFLIHKESFINITGCAL